VTTMQLKGNFGGKKREERKVASGEFVRVGKVVIDR
jgi:hypothetical protein